MTKRASRLDLIKKLVSLWDAVYKVDPYLKVVSISNTKCLRGIRDSSLSLEFPVSVICGENGSGKTTFLSLGILGFHSIKKPLTTQVGLDYFNFNYFFRSAANDKHDQGIEIQWEYSDGSVDRIEKGNQRWLRYIKNNGDPRRKLRGTEFIGISRITPAFEKKNYHSYFTKGAFKESDQGELLRKYISQVMKRPYVALSKLSYANSSGVHSVQNYNKTHTSFNAGAGEECLTSILGTLLECESGSLVAIEEIEIGLHPSTLPRLSDVILEIAKERRLQVLITSHSSEFLRAFPSQGLILARRDGERVEFINQPNVEYAISTIGGDHQRAASIICEDKHAAMIIEKALPPKVRAICPIICFGGKDELITKAITVSKYSSKEKVIIIWDGGVDNSYLDKAKAAGFLGLRLPLNQEPEELVISAIRTKDGRGKLKERYLIDSSDMDRLLNSIDSLSDIHDLPHILAESLSVKGSHEALMNEMAGIATSVFSADFEAMIESIEAAL